MSEMTSSPVGVREVSLSCGPVEAQVLDAELHHSAQRGHELGQKQPLRLVAGVFALLRLRVEALIEDGQQLIHRQRGEGVDRQGRVGD